MSSILQTNLFHWAEDAADFAPAREKAPFCPHGCEWQKHRLSCPALRSLMVANYGEAFFAEWCAEKRAEGWPE